MQNQNVQLPSSRSRSGAKRKMKTRKRRAATQGTKSLKRLELLRKNVNLVPFPSAKSLNLSLREALLKRIGLWDFAILELDARLHPDLVLKLIASYNPLTHSSKVGKVKIKVDSANLGRCLKLPSKKDKESFLDTAVEYDKSDEALDFLLNFVSNRILLHEDVSIMPAEVLDVIRCIREGCLDSIDWANIVWIMVEKELKAKNLVNCYYASHLQYLMRCQCKELFQYENHTDCVTSDDALINEYEARRGCFEGNHEESLVRYEDEQQHAVDGLTNSCLRIVGDFRDPHERRQEMMIISKSNEEKRHLGDEEFAHHLRYPASNDMNCLLSNSEIPTHVDTHVNVHTHMNGILDPNFDLQKMLQHELSGGIDDKNIDNQETHNSVHNFSKRMRASDGLRKEVVDLNMCIHEFYVWEGKTKQVLKEMQNSESHTDILNKCLINELHMKESVIQKLQEEHKEENQRRQDEIFQLERELCLTRRLVAGYREALKETNKQFEKYRAKAALPKESVYKDVFSEGLVLSDTDLKTYMLIEKDKQQKLCGLVEDIARRCEAKWVVRYKNFEDTIQGLFTKLVSLENEFRQLLARTRLR